MSRAPAMRFDAERNIIVRGGRRLVFHCHHYNVYLQRTIEDGLGERAAWLLSAAASESARAAFEELEREQPAGSPRALIERAGEIFATQGFGRADVSGLGPHGGRIELVPSHYALGWVAKWGRRETPCCHFAVGFFAAAVAVAGGHASERIRAYEVRCAAAGAESCSLVVEVW